MSNSLLVEFKRRYIIFAVRSWLCEIYLSFLSILFFNNSRGIKLSNRCMINDHKWCCRRNLLYAHHRMYYDPRMFARFGLISFSIRGHFRPSGIVVACVFVFVCPCGLVSVCINLGFVRAITNHSFKLAPLNLEYRCKRPWLRSLLFYGVIDLDLQGQI